jgi:PAS domain-containing protein
LSYHRGRSPPSGAQNAALCQGVRRITDATLDWDRITRWTAEIAADDITAITATFAGHGAAAPGLTWNPAAEHFDAEALRFLTSYWHGLAGRGPPHVKQIDPLALRPALGYVMLLDLVEGGRDFRYRLYGSMIASISCFDMTGKLLSEHPASPYVTEFALASYRAAVQRRQPVFTERHPVGAVQTTRWQRVALPLIDDDGAVIRLLAGTAPIARDGRTLRAKF